jgi:transcriptional regulator with XRE-family HTH domain
MYPNLKLQLWRSGIRQCRLAQMIGVHETLLSRIVNGFRQPDAATRVRIAAALRADEDWLFTRAEAPSTLVTSAHLPD